MLTPTDISERTALSYRVVLRAINDGELPAWKLRGQLRVQEEDFDAWLESNRVKPWSPRLD